jgi:hypothetical protein
VIPDLPQPAWAVIRALRLDERSFPELDAAGWREALAFADRTRLTLLLRDRWAGSEWWRRVPARVRQRLDQNLAGNTERLRNMQRAFAEITGRFSANGIDFVLLKGLSHCPDFIADPTLRMQYDFDFYFPRRQAERARDVLLGMGYEPLAKSGAFPTDHLPTMIRKTGWQWRGNFFDPEIPAAVDLHYRFWDFETERLAAPGVDEFWNRRVGARLWLPDRLGYAALHAVRHLFRGSLQLAHIHEIACFIGRRKNDEAFWNCWLKLHPPELRMLESIAFRLAEIYFGAPAVQCSLPEDLEPWFARYAWSPVKALFRPNKHELYLHLGLLPARANRWRVARRRLFPIGLPSHGDTACVPDEQITLRMRIRRWTRYGAFLASRVMHHSRALLPTLYGLCAWRRRSRQ